ncbi:acetyl-CoA carboxylase biotin carboxyl carrier protein [Blattabacterium cuenoti]|uniref:acetyl-CoA carboxylase biotin carboxyl carrier protein n=1 Tax=Blattabacterium cuenoti TaxID=1653831 RepID=UPI00163C00EA|nr:acetyl-CoA carboxylase biotin carboxyl carrier protein [Blattabacterium cuenoti]
MDFKEIKSLIQLISKSDIREIIIKIGDTKIHIKNNNELLNSVLSKKRKVDTPISDLTDKVYQSKLEKNDQNNQFITIRSPMIGTFYRKPNPEKDPFVKVGDQINIGTKICVIEAMKLFNDIESEVCGKLVKVFVEDSTPVDYDQPLFLLSREIDN